MFSMIWADNEQIGGFFLPDHGKFESAGIRGAEVADEACPSEKDPAELADEVAGPAGSRPR